MYLIKATYKTDYSYDRTVYFGSFSKRMVFRGTDVLEDFITGYSIARYNKEGLQKKLNLVPEKMVIDGMNFTLLEKQVVRYKYVKRLGLQESVVEVFNV